MKFLNRNHLKYIAVVAMLIDHFANFFLGKIWGTPLYIACRFIGRLTAPVMCYFLCEGFIHTLNKKKYFLRLLIFAIISQVAFDFVHILEKEYTLKFSMIYTLLCCFLMLWSIDYFKNVVFKVIGAGVFIILAYWGDWGTYAPLWVLGFYLFRKYNYLKLLPFVLVSGYRISVMAIDNWGKSFAPALMMAGVFAFIPLILLYNGKSGSKNAFNKWFFYIIYPAHLFIIGGILLLIYYLL